MIKAQFLGGAEEVGSLGFHMEIGELRLLFEYGLTPSKPPSYPMPSPPVDSLFLTHVHLDHSGMIPRVAVMYEPNIYATEPTIAVLPLMWNDTIKVADLEGFPIPYTKEEVESTTENLIPVEYGRPVELGSLEIVPHNAGHIPGSAMYEIRDDRKILFTGDIQTVNTNLVWGTKAVKTDVLIMESTYAGREHPPRDEVERNFVAKIEEIVNRGGKAIIPVFAVGRTQEIMLILAKTDFDVWIDGMGRFVTNLFLQYPQYLKSAKKLKKARNKMNIVKRRSDRRKALNGEVIVATGGMLEGGPVLHYINHLKNDRKSGILLTGYQVEGTNGRLLMDEGILELYGIKEKIDMDIEFFDFSAHAGHSELLEFAEKCSPEKIILMHGDNREALAKDLKDMGFDVCLPKNGEDFII
ncbi:MBL fold metallo-hydrolase [Euryarchaeota archaeon ex4484_178]|nr:MAG: MBL fold metallo-hydrolase [Euryarchaeota archaeon ex4484_178]